MHIDHVIERGRPSAFFPHITGEHFTGNNTAMIAREIFEKLELARGEIDTPPFPADNSPDRINFERRDGQDTRGLWLIASKKSTKARGQLSECKWLHKVVVSPGIQSQHTILN